MTSHRHHPPPPPPPSPSHPRIQLTLTKLRSLKRDMLDIGYRELDFNISTVALAQLCFERLVLSEVITKATRKVRLSAGPRGYYGLH